MALKSYKLEIRDPLTGEKVDFGPRKLGEAGRDILIVKKALGVLVDSRSLIDVNDDNPSLDDPTGWFDCMTGTTISNLEAATFDKNMQTYLTKFQLDNQFYIISYLFTKFTVNQDFERLQSVAESPFAEDPEPAGSTSLRALSSRILGFSIPTIEAYLNSVYTSTQITLITSMFELEFGNLGEATLAVLHGWVPRTRVGEKSYYHDPRLFASQDGAYDLVLLGLYDSFTRNLLSQRIEDTSEVLEPRGNFVAYVGNAPKGIEFRGKYEQQVSTKERIIFDSQGAIAPGETSIQSSYFGAIKYQIKMKEQQSPLYDSFIMVSREHPRTSEPSSLSAKEYADALARNFEPNPLADPDPYVIDSRRLGFFNTTDYTMENLPPRVKEDASPEEMAGYQRSITALEDAALAKVLEYLGKPNTWFHDPESATYLSIYGGISDVVPNHTGVYSTQTKFVLSTATNIEKFGLTGLAEKYNRLEDNRSGEPLVKFIEFRTPSLRPGDHYRAQFTLNRHKLRIIEEGTNILPSLEEEEEGATQTPVIDPVLSPSCDGEPISQADQQRRYEEYRALASQRKREIARIIREKTLESYNNNRSLENTSIDLGVFGNTSLTLDTDSPDFTARAASTLSDIVSGTGTRFGSRHDLAEVTNPKFSDLTELTISFPNLEAGLKKAAENLASAQKNCNEDGITVTPSNFNGATESQKLKSITSLLQQFIAKESNNFETGFTAVSPGEPQRMNLRGFTSAGLSEMKFVFEHHPDGNGLMIKSLLLGSKKVKDIKDLERVVPALKRSRTVGYLAQVREMDTSGSWLSLTPCEDLGVGKKGLAYIVRHTMSLPKQTIPDEFNPINKWAEKNVANPIERWKKLIKNTDTGLGLDAKFGTDELFASIGKQCTSLVDFFSQFVDKHFLTGLLCDYLKCIKLPNFELSLMDFDRPALPDLSIFGWYISLVDSLKKNWREILTGFLCAWAKALLDILANPSCNNQLSDQLYGAASSSSPTIKKALIDGLTDLSLRSENVEKSKDLIDEMALFLTGEELCRVLQGGEIDTPTMNMILRLAARLGIEEVDTEASLREFFETISIFLPEGFCENLNQSTSILGAQDCAETSSLLDQIRRRMLANEATDEEIDHAVDMANKNLMDQATALAVLGEEGLNGIVPTTLEFGNPDALVSALPSVLAEQINRSAKGLFEWAKMGYVSSLSSFGPSLSLQSNRLPKPGDPEYNEESVIIVQTILENLKLFASMGEEIANTKERLTEQLHILHQVYQLEVYPTSGAPKVPLIRAQPAARAGTKIPQGDVADYHYLSHDDRARTELPLFLKPSGFLQSGFYYTDENSVLLTRPDTIVEASRTKMQKSLSDESSLLKEFTFVGAYKIIEKAVEDEVISDQEGPLSFLREKINERLSEMQAILQIHLKSISTPISEKSYLKILRDVLSFSYENAKERAAAAELIDTRTSGGRLAPRPPGLSSLRETINLNLSVGPLKTSIILNEFKSTENTNRFDPYTIEINNSALFRNKQIFEYCDTIPGPGLNEETLTESQSENREMFETAIRGIPPGLYTRRELFARKTWDSVKRKVDFIYRDGVGSTEEEQDSRGVLNNYLDNFLREQVYNTEGQKFSEGIFEQIFFSLRDSRIYDQKNYYEELKRRVNGEVYLSKDDCYKNRYNVSQFGILSFEKMVTDEIADQITIEMAKPENNPYNLDFDDPSPIEKAIQNVCLIGFIRVCIIELVLKGSLAYSVWDVEGVADEPFMKDFVVRFVEQEIERHPSMKDKWQEVVGRVTGIEQPKFALMDLTQKQLIKVQGISKKIFQNDSNLDYYNWFAKYFIPQTEVSRSMVITKAARGWLGFEGQVVATDGQIEGVVQDAIQIENAPDKFYWKHPLLDPTGILTLEDSFNNLRNPVDLATNLLAGNHPFFHIEHCIEVTGPLAQLETLILPGADIIRGIIEAAENDPLDPRLTTVIPIFRDITKLNIGHAYDRLNLDSLNLDNYSLRATPLLPSAAKGSSAETSGDLNRLHEVYHIDDFVDGLNSVFNADHIEKYFLHLRGLMHYDENPEAAPGGSDRNTGYSAANAKPEAIRRTPTRFITKKRKIVKFSRDFVSHHSDSLFADELGLGSYKEYLITRPRLFLEGGDDASETHYRNFKDFVTTTERETQYYILHSSGEEILTLADLDLRAEEVVNSEEFLSYVTKDNGIESVTTPHGGYIDHSYKSLDLNNAQNNNAPNFTAIGINFSEHRAGSRNLQNGRDIHAPVDDTGIDLLTHKFEGNRDDTTVIFTNRLGRLDLFDFDTAKADYENPQEETWVETVFDFSDEASVLVGLHGSFSIGETFDPAVLKFEPDFHLRNAFEDQLKPTINSLYGEGAYDKAKVENSSDPKLTQYGRTLFIRDIAGGPPNVSLARPMGIDRYTNSAETAAWLVGEDNILSDNNNSFTSFPFDSTDPDPLIDIKARSRKLVHHAALEIGDSIEDQTPSPLLPRNFYKIPMRVLVTQIYIGAATTPSEVYCKVVPPNYIKNLHDRAELHANIGRLNAALTQITKEYVQYIDSIRNLRAAENPETAAELRANGANFADFTSDFTRNHIQDWDKVNLPEHSQYCSIERVYSRVFANEKGGLDAVNFAQYNSNSELDALFKDRGQLIVHRSPPPQDLVSLDVSPDLRHYSESCTWLHLMPRDSDIANEEIPDVKELFHKTVFSLSNIFQWYLRNRRSNTLWGALTARQAGQHQGPNRSEIGISIQELPLAQSYSDAFRANIDDNHHADDDEQWQAHRNNLVKRKWAISALPGKSFQRWTEMTRGPSEVTGLTGWPAEDVLWDRHMPVQKTPGFLTLYPGAADVGSIASEGFAPNPRAPNLVRLNKTDFLDWNFYSPAGPGLMSDGVGSNYVNYNRIEHVPLKNAGSSLFHSEGIISQLDISVFIRSTVKKIILDSYDGEVSTLPGDPLTCFNLAEFYDAIGGKNVYAMLGVITGRGTREFDFSGISVFRDLGDRFNPGRLSLNADTINSLLTSLEHVTRRLYDLASSQASFCVKTEASNYNADIREAPYKLVILNKLLARIKVSNHQPEEKLLLLASASTYNLPATLVSLERRLSGQNVTAVMSDIPDDNSEAEAFEDWAVACIHWLAGRLAGDSLVTDDNLDTRLANIFSAGHGDDRTYILHVNASANNPANLTTVGGHPRIGAAASWAAAKGLVLDEARHGFTIKDIIMETNKMHEIIFRRLAATSLATRSFDYNNRILADLNNVERQHGLIAMFGQRYNDALSKGNLFAMDNDIRANRQRLSSQIDDQRAVQDMIIGPHDHSRDTIANGKIEDFFLKLDYRLFFQVLGRDGNPGSFQPATKYLTDYLGVKTGLVKRPGASLLDYYKEVQPRIFYSSTSGTPRREYLTRRASLADKTAVDRLTSLWSNAYESFSGITGDLLSSEVLRSAMVNGEVVAGLLEQSSITQVARLISNTFVYKNQKNVSQATLDYNSFIQNENGVIQEVSEEFRSFRMGTRFQGQDIFSVPLAEHKKSVSALGQVIDACYDLTTFREDYKRLQPWMADQLIESEDAKQILQYIFPVKRYQAVSTAFVSSVLAGYSTMPSIMQTPKGALAALMGTSAMTRKERTQIFDNFSQGEFFKQIMDNATSDPKGLDCFGFPFPGDFLKQFGDLLEELFLQFPSIFFRGIASAVDPAYQEMKKHWENCDINELNWSGTQWATTINEKDMTAGLMGKPSAGDLPPNSNYSMILPSAYIDIYTGAGLVTSNPFSATSWEKFRRALERTAGYLYKGPIALVDGAFSLKIPCLDVDTGRWPGETPAPWNLDRYGHPLSPLTVIALSLPELKGEVKKRQLKGCGEEPYSEQEIADKSCEEEDSEPKPFGDMPTSEEE